MRTCTLTLFHTSRLWEKLYLTIPVKFTCSATFIFDNSSTSGVQYVWSGPAMNDSGSSQILSLHNVYIYLRLESISVLLVYIIHPSLLVFLLFFNVSKLLFVYTKKRVHEPMCVDFSLQLLNLQRK